MCRGFQQRERERLNIKAFYLQLSIYHTREPLPDCLTLHYLPRINGSPLQIDGSDIRPNCPGFVTLHRILSWEATKANFANFGSRERVRASEGTRFEVYLRDEKILKGIFRKGEGSEWKMECKCALEREMEGIEVNDAEICVAVEGFAAAAAAMREKIPMVVQRRRGGKGRSCYKGCLEEIPEEREVESEPEVDCYFCCSSGEDTVEDSVEDGGESEEVDMEGLRWAMDVGFWAVCLGVGVGYLVSKASSRSRAGRRFI